MKKSSYLLSFLFFFTLSGCGGEPPVSVSEIDGNAPLPQLIIFADQEILSSEEARQQLAQNFKNQFFTPEAISAVEIKVFPLNCSTASEAPLLSFELSHEDAAFCKVGKKELFGKKQVFSQAFEGIRLSPSSCTQVMESLEVIKKIAAVGDQQEKITVLYYSRLLEFNEQQNINNLQWQFMKNNPNGSCFEIDEAAIKEASRQLEVPEMKLHKFVAGFRQAFQGHAINLYHMAPEKTFYKEQLCPGGWNAQTRFWDAFFSLAGLKPTKVYSLKRLNLAL